MTEDYATREWWLVRHAPVNAGTIYGHLDLEADFSDSNRLEFLAQLLPSECTVITSDLIRCRETARRILERQKGRSALLHERAALREQSFGIWEGKTYHELEATDTERYRDYFKNPATCKPEGGESFQDLLDRVQGEIDTLLNKEEAQNLVLVTHAGVIRAIVGLALDLTPEKMLSFAVDPLSLTHLTSFGHGRKASWRVNFVNDLNRA
jgi:alpha-ribazole phosphatase